MGWSRRDVELASPEGGRRHRTGCSVESSWPWGRARDRVKQCKCHDRPAGRRVLAQSFCIQIRNEPKLCLVPTKGRAAPARTGRNKPRLRTKDRAMTSSVNDRDASPTSVRSHFARQHTPLIRVGSRGLGFELPSPRISSPDRIARAKTALLLCARNPPEPLRGFDCLLLHCKCTILRNDSFYPQVLCCQYLIATPSELYL